MFGEVVFFAEVKNSGISLDISMLQNGIYFIETKIDGKTQIYKIIVEIRKM